jgi:hypothetical protein
MCPIASELASWLRWALALPRIIWLQSSPLDWGGLRCCHVSYGSGSWLSAEVDFGAATFPGAPCGLRVSSIKKRVVDMHVQLGTHVPNARVHVSKAPHVRAVTHLQDMRAGGVVNTCKACVYASTVRLQCDVGTIDHSSDTATVPSDSTAWRHTADWVQHGRRQDQTCPCRWRHPSLLLAISVLLHRILFAPEPSVGSWVSL